MCGNYAPMEYLSCLLTWRVNVSAQIPLDKQPEYADEGMRTICFLSGLARSHPNQQQRY